MEVVMLAFAHAAIVPHVHPSDFALLALLAAAGAMSILWQRRRA